MIREDSPQPRSLWVLDPWNGSHFLMSFSISVQVIELPTFPASTQLA